MNKNWPQLSFQSGKKTYETLHLFSQIVGKIMLSKRPWINHSWHITFFVTPAGLTTGNIPGQTCDFQIDFDFTAHTLKVSTSSGALKEFSLINKSVADFYRTLISLLTELDIDITINKLPNELEDPTPFDQDRAHATYEPEQVNALHQALLLTHDVLTDFRAEFIGKCSPVQLFWGSFDIAVSRFSGRKAPLHPGGIPNLPDWVSQEAYSHEVCSCGFWPGTETTPYAAFYTYIYPEPAGFKTAAIKPEKAFYDQQLGIFILPYSEVQQAASPAETLQTFLQSTYQAAATLANWDRQALEKKV